MPYKRENIAGVEALGLSSPDGRITATVVSGAGMLISSLQKDGTEFLHCRDTLQDYIDVGKTIGIPILYPWANRLASRSYMALGHDVLLDEHSMPITIIEDSRPIHGFIASKLPWKIGEIEENSQYVSVSASLSFDESLFYFKGFPFRHSMKYGIKLDNSGLELSVCVTVPEQSEAVPVAFGFHPYFRLPEPDRRAWHLGLPFEKEVELRDQMPTGAVNQVRPINGSLGDLSFDDCFISPGKPLSLSDSTHSLTVTMDDNYPYTQVYAPPESDFICFEPMTAAVDPFSQKDTKTVEPGDSFSASFRIAIESDV